METILIPTDFSPSAANAVDYAIELAKFFDSRIVLVHAYPVPNISYEVPFPVETISTFQKISEEKLSALKKEILEKHGRDFDIECISDMGSPFEVIEAAAKKTNADLIVMGIIGEAGAFKEHIIGSTAVAVARKLEVPTFIIPETIKYQRIQKISFACDLEKTEETDLVYVAKYFSKVFDAELEIVNVEDPEGKITHEKAISYLFVEEKLEHVNHKTTHIEGANVAEQLENYFTFHPTNVIMLNPKKHNIFYNLFNQSITNTLAFHSMLPILAIH
ncbi:MAG TPA: universal stress protein [Bacteroidia bacterium]|jgi:nucleotide-binding universal stress UspA family protein|nr:universal stress protein [Bacteroidia bacterium]